MQFKILSVANSRAHVTNNDRNVVDIGTTKKLLRELQFIKKSRATNWVMLHLDVISKIWILALPHAHILPEVDVALCPTDTENKVDIFWLELGSFERFVKCDETKFVF